MLEKGYNDPSLDGHERFARITTDEDLEPVAQTMTTWWLLDTRWTSCQKQDEPCVPQNDWKNAENVI